MIERISANIIVTADPARLAAFYREKLGIPLEEEQHAGGGEALHFGCSLGGIHFAVHPVENWQAASETGPGGTRVAFAIDDAEDAARRLRARGVECLGPLDVGWGKLVFCRDPDGNLIELVRMGRSRGLRAA
ncbi:MAG: VOC family protein [Deltaproteobacteria bacterium]|nr:MAG: VOC family protein [Deltaproteobacteria bacterium]